MAINTQVSFELGFAGDATSKTLTLNIKESPIRFIGRSDFPAGFDFFKPDSATDLVILNQFESVTVTAVVNKSEIVFTFSKAPGKRSMTIQGKFVYV